jgi:hypothetical protein
VNKNELKPNTITSNKLDVMNHLRSTRKKYKYSWTFIKPKHIPGKNLAIEIE